MVSTSARRPTFIRSGARRWTGPGTAIGPADFHRSFPDYRATALVPAPTLAAELGVAAVLVKEESARMGLPAFKILGASWAVNRAVSAHLGHAGPAATLDVLRGRMAGGPALTLVTATDGNHGRAVARMAALLGTGARVYVPAGVSEAALDGIRGESDTVRLVETGGLYDDAVRLAAASARGQENELVIQDTSWPGYEDVPRWIVEGYSTLFTEIDEQLPGVGAERVGLVAVPTGVGSLLQSAVEHYRRPGTAAPPAVVAVEPVTAACVTASLSAGEPTTVDTAHPTIMTGLNCGTPSLAAWPSIAAGLDAAVGVTDDEDRRAVADLARLGLDVGPCGAAALAGVRALLADPDHRTTLAIDPTTTVVLVSTEGLTANPIPL
jgi:diaminopropionate ammonia-lyase